MQWYIDDIYLISKPRTRKISLYNVLSNGRILWINRCLSIQKVTWLVLSLYSLIEGFFFWGKPRTVFERAGAIYTFESFGRRGVCLLLVSTCLDFGGFKIWRAGVLGLWFSGSWCLGLSFAGSDLYQLQPLLQSTRKPTVGLDFSSFHTEDLLMLMGDSEDTGGENKIGERPQSNFFLVFMWFFFYL